MSHPTIHPTGDGHVTIVVPGQPLIVASDRDAETLGQLLADLYGLAGDQSDAPERTGPPAPAPAGVYDSCTVCAGPIEFLQRPDADEYGPLAGRGGWRHLTVEPGQVHTAFPAGGERS